MQIRSRNVAAVLALVIVTSTASHALDATTADDVCPSDADPCNVTEPVHVAAGATLDFSGRAVNVTGAGQFDFGSTSGRIFSGPLHADTTGEAIVAAGPVAGGGSSSGSVTIEARRRCSDGDAVISCLDDYDCEFGACTARRCSLKPANTCTSDESCVGTCTNRRCSNTVLFQRCSTNADCDFGTCPQQLTCAQYSTVPLACSTTADCDFGTCSVGSASITIDGEIDGHSGSGADLTLRAADSITVTGDIDLSSSGLESDGGDLHVEARAGDASFSGKIRARGGGQAYGGYIDLSAGQDAKIEGPIDVTGGDGGSLDMFAYRDVVVSADLNLSGKSGYGSGGSVYLGADRDIRVGNPAGTMRISANGHSAGDGSGGDGGSFDLEAFGDIVVGPSVLIRARGAREDGFGGGLYVSTLEDFRFSGKFDGRGRGLESFGGEFNVEVFGDMEVTPESKIDVRAIYGGLVHFYTEDGDADLAGRFLLSGTSDGESGIFDLDACRVSFAATISNVSDGGYSDITAHEHMTLLPGSAMLAPKGRNVLRYRAAEKPPLLQGVVSPEPELQLNAFIGGCPVCGNLEIDEYETCDDGNLSDGDGCDSDCALE